MSSSDNSNTPSTSLWESTIQALGQRMFQESLLMNALNDAFAHAPLPKQLPGMRNELEAMDKQLNGLIYEASRCKMVFNTLARAVDDKMAPFVALQTSVLRKMESIEADGLEATQRGLVNQFSRGEIRGYVTFKSKPPVVATFDGFISGGHREGMLVTVNIGRNVPIPLGFQNWGRSDWFCDYIGVSDHGVTGFYLDPQPC